MLPSKKFLSLPIISLKEGQQIGFVRNLVIDPKSRAVAALIVDPKGFFKEQRIIPFNRVVSIGENAITVSTESQVEKATNLPDILELLKEKTAIIGIKIITTNGKTLGLVDEFYINAEDGSIACLDFSGGKIEGLLSGRMRIKANEILTMGTDVIVVAKDCTERIEALNKGLNQNVKSFIQTASGKAAEKKHKISNSWRTRKNKKIKESEEELSAEQIYSEAEYAAESPAAAADTVADGQPEQPEASAQEEKN